MSTEFPTVNTPWLKNPDQVMEVALRRLDVELPADQEAMVSSDRASPSLKSVMDEFVRLLKDNPKVWAVYATEDRSVITIWTYVDSHDRRDRSPVYAAEWHLLSRYPKVAFDFNVLLTPAGSEQFEAGSLDYVYTR